MKYVSAFFFNRYSVQLHHGQGVRCLFSKIRIPAVRTGKKYANTVAPLPRHAQ